MLFRSFVRLQVRSALRERVALTNRSMAQVLTASVIGAVSKLSGETDADSPLQEWYKPFILPADDMGLWAVRVLPLDDKIPVRSLFLPDKNTVRGEMKRPWEDLWQRMGRRELAVVALDFMDNPLRCKRERFHERCTTLKKNELSSDISRKQC